MDSSLELSLGCLRASSVVGENPTLCVLDEGRVYLPFRLRHAFAVLDMLLPGPFSARASVAWSNLVGSVVVIVVGIADLHRTALGPDDLAIVVIIVIVVEAAPTTAMLLVLVVFMLVLLVFLMLLVFLHETADVMTAVPLRSGNGRDRQRSRCEDQQRHQRLEHFGYIEHCVLLQGLLLEHECSVVPR